MLMYGGVGACLSLFTTESCIFSELEKPLTVFLPNPQASEKAPEPPGHSTKTGELFFSVFSLTYYNGACLRLDSLSKNSQETARMMLARE